MTPRTRPPLGSLDLPERNPMKESTTARSSAWMGLKLAVRYAVSGFRAWARLSIEIRRGGRRWEGGREEGGRVSSERRREKVWGAMSGSEAPREARRERAMLSGMGMGKLEGGEKRVRFSRWGLARWRAVRREAR